MQNKVVPVVKSATDFLTMSEVDITFGVSEQEFTQYQHDFVQSQQEQTEGATWLMYSAADKAQFIVNRINLADGMWEPQPALV